MPPPLQAACGCCGVLLVLISALLLSAAPGSSTERFLKIGIYNDAAQKFVAVNAANQPAEAFGYLMKASSHLSTGSPKLLPLSSQDYTGAASSFSSSLHPVPLLKDDAKAEDKPPLYQLQKGERAYYWAAADVIKFGSSAPAKATVFICRAEDAASADRCEHNAVGRTDISLGRQRQGNIKYHTRKVWLSTYCSHDTCLHGEQCVQGNNKVQCKWTTSTTHYYALHEMNLCFVLPKLLVRRDLATQAPTMSHCATRHRGALDRSSAHQIDRSTLHLMPLSFSTEPDTLMRNSGVQVNQHTLPPVGLGMASITLRLHNDPVLMAERISGVDGSGEVPGFGQTTWEEAATGIFLLLLGLSLTIVSCYPVLQ